MKKIEVTKTIDTEYILCSAIKYNNIVVCGRRCADVIETILAFDENPDKNQLNNNQGFMTSKGRFVDRFDAWDIASDNGQIKYEKTFFVGGKPLLMSINLYKD